jgi:Ala-tRNA(Pro) deacylase
MQAKQTKPSQIYHAARAAGVVTTGVMDDTILKVGATFAAFSASIPTSSLPMLKTLANIGIQYSELQQKVKKDLQESTGSDIPSCLFKLEQSLEGKVYLTGNALSPTDCTLVCAVAPLLSYLYTTQPYPNISRWFNLITGAKWCSDVIGKQRALGTKRIGGQIDLRPNPKEAFAAAMNSIRVNKGEKKKVTQRQLEKEAKKNKKNKKNKGETKTSAASSNPMDASESLPSLPFLLGPRVEVSDGKEKRMSTLFSTLQRLNLSHETVEHVATPTVDDLIRETGHLKGGHCKNLFVKGKKKSRTRTNDTKLWLIVALHDTDIDMKKLSKHLGYKDTMRMGNSDLLNEKLGVIQGEVSPFALTNNSEKDVQLIIDSRMMNEEVLWFHPLTMEASTSLTPSNLLSFIKSSGRNVETIEFDSL